MKKALWLVILITLPIAAGIAAAEEYTEVFLEAIEISTAFPSGWTVVTPETVADHFSYFAEDTPDIAAQVLRSEGVYAAAFSPEGDAMLRVIATEGDQNVSVYYDIDRYTPAMRAAIRNDFLDREAWALTGYRYTEAEWTNKALRGRLLNLTYAIRQNNEVVARGLQVYTIHAGRAFTLDLQVRGRQPTSKEKRAFEDFVAQTAFPSAANMPPLPVGLTLTGPLPEETNAEALTIRGQTMAGASVTAWMQPPAGELLEAGSVKAGSGGGFRMDITLPGEGEFRLHMVASLEGYADTEESFWVSYDRNRIPVTFTSCPEGEVLDPQVVIAGKTLKGVTIEWAEGATKKSLVTGADGVFSIKPDRAAVGPRTVTMTLKKENFATRQLVFTFNRQWRMEDYVKYLSDKVEPLSYAKLCENPQKYAGRQVRYTGQVIGVSGASGRHYVQLALTKGKDGVWADHIVAVADGLEITLSPGDNATLYVSVTGETYAFSTVTPEGDEVDMDLPSVKLMAYQRN